MGGALTAISPVVAYFNPTIGGGMASARLVFRDVGALGVAGKAMLRGGNLNPHVIRRTIDDICSDAGAVRSAYSAVRGASRNPLERGR